jgi:hypothetical protein
MPHRHNHHYKGGWYNPLCSLQDIPTYCMNLMCPWAPINALMQEVENPHFPSDGEFDEEGHLTLCNSMASALTCAVPCCMLVGEGVRDEQQHTENEFLAFMGEDTPAPQQYPRWATGGMLCFGAVCLLPTLYRLRRRVDRKVHNVREPPWQTAFATCCAWPCSLTQMGNEMHTVSLIAMGHTI